MKLKKRILLTVLVAAIVTSILTGRFLIYLLRTLGNIELSVEEYSLAVVFAILLCLVSGLFLLGLLNTLLSKNVVIPAVERELLENERTMLSNQLRHAQKMEAVGQLASSIAHDFNNLLTIIDGYSSLIIADPVSKDVQRHAQEVVDAARKASFITRKLLSFSQKDRNEPVLLDLNSTLQDTHKMLSRLIGEKIALVTKAYDEPIYAKADPVQIGQVLMNLAVNARDAMPHGGRITIKIDCRQVNHDECGKPSRLPEGRYAEIAVHDTGVGMDEETLARVFEAFFTTKKEGKGTGLGLSIVKSIMKENSGFVAVESKPGSGSTFRLYLPAVDLDETDGVLEGVPSEASATEESIPAGEPVDYGATTILLAEDDPMIRTLVVQTLETQGFTVLVAEDGWEGVKIARNTKGRIDLLLTDVVMPGLGGGELAVAMKELYPEIKTLFMSGYARSQLDEEGVPPDAPLLEKPFTPDKILTMVRKTLAG